MTTPITKEQVARLRNDFECWQQDYDPVADKEQHDMFGLGMVAMDALLAAMYSGYASDELPLDYIQGHQDGLEWAAKMAEANHPETGDWFYDDPIELAKAIRKGPDIPEVCGNSPVIPDYWIAAVNRLLDSDGGCGSYHAIESAEARAELERLLTAQQAGSVSN